MKKLNLNLFVLVLALGALQVSSCSKSGGGKSAPVAPIAPIAPSSTNVGFYSQTQNFVVNNYLNNNSQFSAQSGISAVLKEAMGTCDRNHSNGGLASCSTWARGEFDLVLWVPQGATSNQVRVILRALPGSQLNDFGSYSYSFPRFSEFIGCSLLGICINTGNSAGIFNPMVLDGNIWPINNNQGFEVRFYGPRLSQAYNKTFQLQVNSGKLEDGAWNYRLLYNNTEAASGTAIRCQSQHCGMDASYFRASSQF